MAESLPAYLPFCLFTDGRRPFRRIALSLSPPLLQGLQTTSRFSFPRAHAASLSRAVPFLSPRRGAIVLTSIFYISLQPLNALTADIASNNRASRGISHARARDTCRRAQLENTIRRNWGLIISNGHPSRSGRALASARFAIII